MPALLTRQSTRPPLVHGSGHHRFQGLDVAYVGDITHRLPAGFLAQHDRLLDRLCAEVANDDFGAFGREFDGGRLTYAPARAGDNRYLVLKSHRLPF
jgi:hypothetical protein